MWRLFSAIVLLSILASAVNSEETPSPCPGRFDYVSRGSGQWVGSLNILSDYKLYGTWIRLMFDKPVKDVQVENDALEVAYKQKEPTGQILLKNHDLILLKGKPTKIQFTVSYEGKEPVLVGYRLNGRDICPGTDE